MSEYTKQKQIADQCGQINMKPWIAIFGIVLTLSLFTGATIRLEVIAACLILGAHLFFKVHGNQVKLNNHNKI